MRHFLFVILFLLALGVNASFSNSLFIRADTNENFIHSGKFYTFRGINLGHLGPEGVGGNRTRLCWELNLLKSIDVENLRVLVCAEGGVGIKKTC